MKKWLFQEANNPSIVTKLVDLMILNFVFIISCLPIITIGASLTALYSVALKMADPKKDYFLLRDFIKSFKENFLQSTTAMGVLLLLVAIFAVFINLINLIDEPTLFITMPFLVIVALFGLVAMYLFTLIAYFENRLAGHLKNALIISFHQMAKSIVLYLIALMIIVIIPLFIWQGWFWWLLISFSLTAYLQSLILRKIFVNYTTKQN